jgi:hypothetical protein
MVETAVTPTTNNKNHQYSKRVVVLFMREMPFAWLRLSETFAQQQFEREMATNPDFVWQVTAVFPSE